MLKTREGFNSSIFTTERTLPASFKEAVPSFDGTRLDYQNYTCVLVDIIAKTKRAEIENEMSKTSLFSLPFFSCIYWNLNNN